VTGGGRLGPNPVALLFRHVFAARVRAVFAGRSRVVDLGSADLRSQRDLDGAFAGPGVLDDEDLAALGPALARALRSGAPVLLCLRREGASRVRLPQARTRLGPDLAWSDAFGLGVIVPAESRERWVRRHPQAFGVLAAIEGLVRRWPLLREAGYYLVIEGVRR
jgi:hypothetical protein